MTHQPCYWIRAALLHAKVSGTGEQERASDKAKTVSTVSRYRALLEWKTRAVWKNHYPGLPYTQNREDYALTIKKFLQPTVGEPNASICKIGCR